MRTLINNFYLKISIFILACLIVGISSLNLYIEEKLPKATEIKDIELQIPLKIFTSDKKLIGEFGEKR